MIGHKFYLGKYGDGRGTLMAVNHIPFDAKRVFFISDVPYNSERGNHFSTTSSFFYSVVKGKCKVELDNGVEKEISELSVGEGILFPSNTWMRIFDFSKDAILCVLSDKEYDPSDYISDYEEFLRIVRNDNV